MKASILFAKMHYLDEKY